MMLCRFNAVEQDYNEQILSNKTTGELTEHFQAFTQTGDTSPIFAA